MKRTTQKPTDFKAGHDELKHALSELKSSLSALKAFLMIVPYPITMWNKNGEMVYANNEALHFFGHNNTGKEKICWENHLIKHAGIPKPEVLVEEKELIVLPAGQNEDLAVTAKMPLQFAGIETIICPVPDAEKGSDLVLITHINKIKEIAAPKKNSGLRKELNELLTTKRNLEKISCQECLARPKQLVGELETKVFNCLECALNKKGLESKKVNNQIKKIENFLEKKNRRELPEQESFSPAELKVCEKLKTGQTGKEIAGSLNLSYATVHTHMNNIRKKLHLRGKKVNLKTYLMKQYGEESNC